MLKPETPPPATEKGGQSQRLEWETPDVTDFNITSVTMGAGGSAGFDGGGYS